MTRRESILLLVLINLVIAVAFAFSIGAISSSIKESNSRTSRYENQIKALKSASTGNQSGAISNGLAGRPIEEVCSQFLGMLKKQGVFVEQYQISKGKTFDTATFNFNCSAVQFFGFIYSLKAESYDFTIKTLVGRNGENGISGSFTISNEPCRLKDYSVLVSRPKKIVGLLGVHEEPVKETVKPEEKPMEKPVYNFSIVGYITDSDNSRNLFIKDLDTGRMLTVRQKDIVAETENSVTIIYNQEKVEIKR